MGERGGNAKGEGFSLPLAFIAMNFSEKRKIVWDDTDEQATICPFARESCKECKVYLPHTAPTEVAKKIQPNQGAMESLQTMDRELHD